MTFEIQNDNILLAAASRMRKCRNWQTSKTKDLVAAMPCGFKSPSSAGENEPQDFVINVLRFFVYAEDYSPFVRQKEEKMEKIASFTGGPY